MITELEPLFHDLQQRVQNADYSEMLSDFMPTFAEQEAGMFAGEFDSSLVNWAPLAKSTNNKKGHDRILVETGALRESLVNIGGTGNINAASKRGMLFGTDVSYASFLQEGTSKMPARPPVGISEETLDELCNAIADATVKLMKG